MGSQSVKIYNELDNETLNYGAKNVATAGTAEALASSTLCYEVLIQAKRTNTSRIYVGGASVPNNDTGGVFLIAGQSMVLTPKNLDRVYINSVVNGEGVTFIYW